jgi:hypothetical protein
VIEIRSYRRVFDLERRIYSVEGFRLNPAGIPVRGVIYFLGAVAAILTVTAMPLIGPCSRAIAWYLRDLVLPGAAAAVLCAIRIDGRTFHLAARGMLDLLARPTSVSGLARASAVGQRWIVPELLMLPDGSDPRLRRFRYRGPGAMLVQVEHRREGVRERDRVGLAGPGATLRLSGPSRGRRLARGKVVVLDRDGCLLVAPARRGGRS